MARRTIRLVKKKKGDSKKQTDAIRRKIRLVKKKKPAPLKLKNGGRGLFV